MFTGAFLTIWMPFGFVNRGRFMQRVLESNASLKSSLDGSENVRTQSIGMQLYF